MPQSFSMNCDDFIRIYQDALASQSWALAVVASTGTSRKAAGGERLCWSEKDQIGSSLSNISAHLRQRRPSRLLMPEPLDGMRRCTA